MVAFLALVVTALVRFVPAATAHRHQELAHPDARYAFVAPFHIEIFEEDVAKAADAYQMSPRERDQMQRFLQRAKAEAATRRADLAAGAGAPSGPSRYVAPVWLESVWAPDARWRVALAWAGIKTQRGVASSVRSRGAAWSCCVAIDELDLLEPPPTKGKSGPDGPATREAVPRG
jgi:hypothetical protein